MAQKYEFNAPKFVDFSTQLEDSDDTDTFFDVESPKCENKENNPDFQLITPNSTENIDTTKVEPSIQSEMPENKVICKRIIKVARRLSGRVATTGNITMISSQEADVLSKDLNQLSMKAKKRTHFDGILLNKKAEKDHIMTTRRDEAAKTPKIELRTRSVIKDEPTDQSRKRKSMFTSTGTDRIKKPRNYMAMSMAEQILHFQKDTPPRFHTSKRSSFGSRRSMQNVIKSYNLKQTKPLTPKLLTAMRSRPVEVVSQAQKEDMELDDMKNHQIKANPLNEKVLQPPKPIQKSLRPKIVQEPFNITQVFKKPAPRPDNTPYKFTAKPVPKVILEKPIGIGPKPVLPITIPHTPAITKSARFLNQVRVPVYSNNNELKTKSLDSFGVPFSKFTLPKNTEVKPFSFESRDKEMLEKKEKKILEILEAEKKAREFKANPVPAILAPKEVNRSSKHLDTSRSTIKNNDIEEKSYQPFRARSPRVLRKDPFKVKKEHLHSQPLDVHLWTERRAQERQEYEMKQQEKEDRLALDIEEIEINRKLKEKEEIAKLRKESIFKAQPMPKFKPAPKPVPSDAPLTQPRSPRFTKRNKVTPCPSQLK